MTTPPNDDGSPLNQGVDPAAQAALKAEWDRISHLFGGDMSDVDDAELILRTQILADYQARHVQVFKALQTPQNLLDLEKLKESTVSFEAAVVALDEAEENLLQAAATQAEACSALQVALLSELGRLESLTSEEWAQMEESQRVALFDSLIALRAQKGEMLSQLPLELRQQSEREWRDLGLD